MDHYCLISSEILPEAILKTLQAKDLLEQGQADTVHEAVEQVGLSRSAFYRYRDGIFHHHQLMQNQITTISLNLIHRSGVLSQVLSHVAQYEGNVLTINQSIPLRGKANVVLTVDTTLMADRLSHFLDSLKLLEGVSQMQITGQS